MRKQSAQVAGCNGGFSPQPGNRTAFRVNGMSSWWRLVAVGGAPVAEFWEDFGEGVGIVGGGLPIHGALASGKNFIAQESDCTGLIGRRGGSARPTMGIPEGGRIVGVDRQDGPQREGFVTQCHQRMDQVVGGVLVEQEGHSSAGVICRATRTSISPRWSGRA